MTQPTWTLPKDLLSASVRVMRPQGALGNEGLGLWFGTADGDDVSVTHLVELHGRGFTSAPLQLRLSWRAMSTLTNLAAELDVYLVGQIHSHPGQMLDLSEVDKEFGIRCQDYLSLVCPHYAQCDIKTVDECGVHVFEAGYYRRLARHEVAVRIKTSNSMVERLRVEVPA